MFLLAASARQYPRPAGWSASGERSATIVCNSAAFTPGCSAGSFAEPGQPDRHPQEAERAEADEDLAPGQELEQPQHQRRRQAADQVRAREEDALDGASLAPGDPAREGARDAGPRAGLTDTEQEADGQQER